MSDPSAPDPTRPPYEPATTPFEPAPLAYQVPVPPLRPTSVTVLAIIGIVFGALGLICAPIGVVPYFVPSMGAQNNAIGIVQQNKVFLTVTIVMLAIQFLLAALLVASSIGSLKLKRWARQGMVSYAIGALVMAVAYTAFQCVAIVPLLFARARGGTPQQVGEAWGALIGAVFGFLVGLILPAFILIFFNKRHVVDAFDRGSSLDG